MKKKAKARRIEEKTVFLLKDGEKIAIHKRPASGLLAGLYEFPNTKGKLTQEEALRFVEGLSLSPVRIQPIGEAKHIFSHVEWHMTGYAGAGRRAGTHSRKRHDLCASGGDSEGICDSCRFRGVHGSGSGYSDRPGKYERKLL